MWGLASQEEMEDKPSFGSSGLSSTAAVTSSGTSKMASASSAREERKEGHSVQKVQW